MTLTFDPRQSCFTLSVLLNMWIAPVTGFVITLNPQYPVAGQNVILNVTVVNQQIRSFTWYKGASTDSANQIFTYYPGASPPQVNQSQYFDRASGLPDGSLQITDLRITDKGDYTVQIITLSTTVATVYLPVYELLQTPKLTISSSRPLHGDNVTFHCDAGNQTVSNYTFYRNHQTILCSPPHVICNSSTPSLSFDPITENDSGNYTCIIWNPISSNTSNTLSVTVIEKVSNVTLVSNNSGPVNVNEDSVSLTCSARGTDVHYSWSLSGAALPSDPRYRLNQNNSSLNISPVTEADNGTFTCTASNSVNNETSSPLRLSWYPNGKLQCLADFSKVDVDLQCLWPGGNPAAKLHLQFKNINMSGTDSIVTSIHRNNLTLNTLLYCHGSQENQNQTCFLDIGTPNSVGFNNDSTTEGIVGKSVTLTINLQNRGERQTNIYQVLPANFTWYKLTPDPSPLPSEKNFSVISTANQSNLTINPVTKEVGGRYMCVATNPLGNTSFVFQLNITEDVTTSSTPGTSGSSSAFPTSAPPSGLSGGEIAGIVIGVLAGVAIIAIIIFFIIKAQKKKSVDDHSRENNHVNEGNIEYAVINRNSGIPLQQQPEERDDVKYSSVVFQNKDPSNAPKPQPNETEYSTVKTATK